MKHKFPLFFILIITAIIGMSIVASFFMSNNPYSHTKNEPMSAAVEEEEEEEEEPVEPELFEEEAEETAAQPEPESEPVFEQETPLPLEKYKDLLEINPYVAGWLRIDGTGIDDPVVYTPGSQNYFLHRDLDGNTLEKGTFFIAINWFEGSGNTLIYGHNMKDGTGFGALSRFADKNFGLSHSKIHFDTLYEEKEYDLLAVFYSQIEEEELETEEDRANRDAVVAEKSIEKKEEEEGEIITVEELTVPDLDLHLDLGDADIYRAEKDEDNGRFRYYYYTDLTDRADFDYYIDNIRQRALYDTGAEVSYGDELLTLSTCSYQVKNGRLVVVAVHH